MKDGFIKIAAGVPEIALGDCELNADRIISMAREMSLKGVRLAVFTELGVTGYTLEDLFLQQTLLSAAENALARIIIPLPYLAPLPISYQYSFLRPGCIGRTQP